MARYPDHATVGSAALSVLSVPCPVWPMEALAALVETAYGIHGRATPLHGERDQNALIEAESGRRYVFRLFHPAQDEAAAAYQGRALRHVERTAPDLTVPRVVATCEGASECRIRAGGGSVRLGRLETFLPGTPLLGQLKSQVQAHALGGIAAEIDRALEDLPKPPACQPLLWDFAQAAGIGDLVPSIADTAERLMIEEVFAAFRRDGLARLASLRHQAIHGDLNPGNVLADDAGRLAIIDFGDLGWSARVGEVAIAAAYWLGPGDGDAVLACGLVAAYQVRMPLTAEELDVLPLLIATRLAASLTISAWRAKRFPSQAHYLLRNRARALAGLVRLADGGLAALERQLRAACRGL